MMMWTGQCWQILSFVENCTGIQVFLLTSGKYLYVLHSCGSNVWTMSRTWNGTTWENVTPDLTMPWSGGVFPDASENSTGDLAVQMSQDQIALFDGESKQWSYNISTGSASFMALWNGDYWGANVTQTVFTIVGIHLEDMSTIFEETIHSITAQGSTQVILATMVLSEDSTHKLIVYSGQVINCWKFWSKHDWSRN